MSDPKPEKEWKPDYSVTPRWVVCAAMRRKSDGRIIAGARHYDKVIRGQIQDAGGREAWFGCEQGFIDQFGDFLTREEAWEVAERNGQIKRVTGTAGTLYSEDLY